MGLFSSKKKTYVNTSFSRLIEDKDIPDVRKMAILEYTTSNDIRTSLEGHGLADYFNTYNYNAIGNKMRRATKWAKKNYSYGVPTANTYFKDSVNLKSSLEEFLLQREQDVVTVDYAELAPANEQHVAYQKLIDQYGFDIKTNKLTLGSEEIYLKDLQVVYCSETISTLIDPASLDPYGYSPTSGATPFRTENRSAIPTSWTEDPDAIHDYAVVTTSKSVDGKEVTGQFTINFLDYEFSGVDTNYEVGEGPDMPLVLDDENEEKDYIHARYKTSTGEIKLFTYAYGSGIYPQLDRLFIIGEEGINEFTPNIYFRLMSNDLAHERNKDTDQYKDSIALCKRLDLDWLSVADEITNNVESMKDVVQNFITTCVPMDTESELSKQYLYRYFEELYQRLPDTLHQSNLPSTANDFLRAYTKGGVSISISDKVHTTRLGFKSIGYTDVRGKIGKVGTVSVSFDQAKVLGNRMLHALVGGVSRGLYRQPDSYLDFHTLRKQITPTIYREYVVYGLTSTQVVRGGHTTTASGDDEFLMIPLDMTIVRAMGTGINKNRLISESLHIVFNTLKTVKKKWYQSGIFKAILFVVAVFISVWTGGAGMTLYAIAYAVVQTIVVGAIINLAIKFMVNQLGLNAGVIFAVVAIVALIAGGYATLAKTNVAGLTSQQLVSIANQSFNISNNGYALSMQKLTKEFNKSAELFQDKMDDLQKQIEETGINEVIGHPIYLMSELPTASDIRVGESPSDFITRTLSCDSNLATLSIIGNYVDLSVQLPTFISTYYGAKSNELEQPI